LKGLLPRFMQHSLLLQITEQIPQDLLECIRVAQLSQYISAEDPLLGRAELEVLQRRELARDFFLQ